MEGVKSFNLFREASSELCDWLLKAGKVKDYKPGQVLIPEGEISSHIIIVIEGEVAVNTTDQRGQLQNLATLTQGSIAGEMSWLENRPAVADIVTKDDSKICMIEIEKLEELPGSNLKLAAELQKAIAKKLAAQISNQNAWIHRYSGPGGQIEPLRKVLVLFSELEERDVNTLANLGSLKRIHPQETLIKQGDNIPSVYLILAGEADIYVEIDEVSKKVGSSRRGELLGELTLLMDDSQGATATVQSKEGMEVMELNKAKLNKELINNASLSTRFYRSISCMLSQRSRDQLLASQLAARSQASESNEDADEIELDLLGGINRAGQRFNLLCQKFQGIAGVES